MISDPAPVRRRILLGVVGSCFVLVLISALMPDQVQREVNSKRQKIVALQAVAPPPQPSTPAIRIRWRPGSGTMPGRDVRVHVYAQLGKPLARTDVLLPGWVFESGGRGETIIHLRFDPKDPDEVRLATVLASTSAHETSGGVALRQEALGAGRRLSVAMVRHRVRKFEQSLAPSVIAAARTGVLDEMADGTAGAQPPGTVLYECEGRFFRAPLPGTSSSAPLYRGHDPAFTEATEAFADRRVALP
ncbi:hypothetical protein EON81_28190 [bacterium]|nr:MAG: hypothetical protein EON81_28190 [bacterium]